VDLIGRADECAVLDGLLDAARHGLSETIVVRGEPGVGKTALIDYAVERAENFLLVRFTGVKAESELGYAALHRLLTPVLHQVAQLPQAQAEALGSALGLHEGLPANPFLVGLGTISLAAKAARARTRLLCVIDDSQWVDRESLAALAFWGRRIHAEGIALVFGDRTEESQELDGLNTLTLTGLTSGAARSLLSSVSRSAVAPDVARQLAFDTSGNPLALIELAHELTADQLAGAAALPHHLLMTGHLEERFTQRVRALPADTQMLLLLAAADSSGSPAVIWRAAALIGVLPTAGEAAEAAGLINLADGLTFRHPLIRSAVYGGARPSDRRAAHRTLATATDGATNPDRQALHRAAAAVGPDEEVALALERAAHLAGNRGSHAARAALSTRAAELTPDAVTAARRRLAAAEAALVSGAPMQTTALVTQAYPDLASPALRARARRLEGCAQILEGQSASGAVVLLAAARDLLALDIELGRQTLLEAGDAALMAGHLGVESHVVALEVAALARALPTGDGTEVDVLLEGLSGFVGSGVATAVRHLPRGDPTRWPVLVSRLTRAVWDEDAHDDIVLHTATAARASGDLAVLGAALEACAQTALWAGRFEDAASLVTEADDLAPGAGALSHGAAAVDLLAWQGAEVETRRRAMVALEIAAQHGLGSLDDSIECSLTTLDLGLGRYSDALAHARKVFERDPLCFGNEVLPDLVEAASRTGDLDIAQLALSRLEQRVDDSGTPWALGILARSRALLANGGAEQYFQSSLDNLGRTRHNAQLARTHLLYGEWLRRQKRRLDARSHLRLAHEVLDSIGSEAFAERARTELLATGEHARRRSVDQSNALTPQEAHVARLAAQGDTNVEIAAHLYLSTSTVEYHLHKVFRKLDIRSRRELRGSLPLVRT
jgi:DNA-binding CsgD family transcriptional regulator